MKKLLLILPLGMISLLSANSDITALYKSECASCHMAYQAEFLPKRSWLKMMDNLSNHFDTDASLSKEDNEKIRQYLVENSSDSGIRINREILKFAQSIPNNESPIAITQIPKFKKEHRKIPNKVIAQEEVKSLSNCIACHTDANKGFYDEHKINIPNYGRWDD